MRVQGAVQMKSRLWDPGITSQGHGWPTWELGASERDQGGGAG